MVFFKDLHITTLLIHSQTQTPTSILHTFLTVQIGCLLSFPISSLGWGPRWAGDSCLPKAGSQAEERWAGFKPRTEVAAVTNSALSAMTLSTTWPIWLFNGHSGQGKRPGWISNKMSHCFAGGWLGEGFTGHRVRLEAKVHGWKLARADAMLVQK